MIYYKLICLTCSASGDPGAETEFTPLRSDTPGELISPNYSNCQCSHCGGDQPVPWWVDKLRAFHERHSGHRLEEVEDYVVGSVPLAH